MYNPTNIFELVREERKEFLDNDIEIVDGCHFNQYKTIQKIHKYYSGHYDGSDYEVVNGITRKKIFHNINKWRCMVSTKMIDVDTSQIKLIPKEPDYDWPTFLLEKDLGAWLQKSRFGKLLNKISSNLPRYGSVVLRKTKDGADIVDLRNFFIEQSAESCSASRFNIIKHNLTCSQLRKKRGVWDNVDFAIDNFRSSVKKSYVDGQEIKEAVNTPYVEVYERWGEVPKSFLTDKEKDSNDYVYSWMIVAGVDNIQTNEDGKKIGENGVVLFRKEIKEEEDLPLIDIHYNKVEGRWLGVGVVEDTFEQQRIVNKVKNYEDKAMELSSLLLLTTPDDTVVSNVLTDLENGDLIQSQQGINRIDNRNLASGEFSKVSQEYETSADRATFSYDVVRGEGAPATATLGSVQLQAQQAASVYDFIRENIGLGLEQFFEDLVIPGLIKEKSDKHYLLLTGGEPEVQKIREKMVDVALRERGVEKIEAADKQKMVDDLKRENKIWVEVEKNYYDKVKEGYGVKIVVTGEGVNIQSDLTNLNYVIELVSKNPTMLANPVLKRLLFKMMAKTGMNISELEALEVEQPMQPTQAPQIPEQLQPNLA